MEHLYPEKVQKTTINKYDNDDDENKIQNANKQDKFNLKKTIIIDNKIDESYVKNDSIL